MKSRISRLLSLVLVMCLLLSCFAVFASADSSSGDGSDTGDTAQQVTVGINRTFDEGWDYTNGIPGALSSSVMKLNYERNYDLSYNYFFYVECNSGDNEYITFNAAAGSSREGYSFIEFDMKAAENCYIKQFIQSITGSGSTRDFMALIGYQEGQLLIMDQVVTQSDVDKSNEGKLSKDKFEYSSLSSGEWLHFSFRFDFDYAKRYPYSNISATTYQTIITIENEKGQQLVVTKTHDNVNSGKFGFDQFRIGFAADAAFQRIGQWYAIDNFKMYYGTDRSLELNPDDYGYGTLVDVNLPRNYPMLGTDNASISRDELYAGSMFMKVGVEYALLDEMRVAILQDEDEGGAPVGLPYGAPHKHTDPAYKGKVMIPLSAILRYIGYESYEHLDKQSYDIPTGASVTYLTIGRDTATVGGELVELTVPAQIVTDDKGHSYPIIALDDVEALFPGYYATYDNMGLIAISRYDDVFNRSTDLDWMVSIMKAFVYDYPKADEVYEKVKENTNNFDHPYLYTTQARFDELNAIYNAPEGSENYNLTLKNYMYEFVATADKYLNQSYVEKDAGGNFVRFKEAPFELGDTYGSDGYDTADGGRFGANIFAHLETIAFAYQVTRNINYARFAYDWIVELGKLQHWGPGHFLNCAEGAKSVATAIDWMYDAFNQLGGGKSADQLVKILYTHGTYMGYRAASGMSNLFPSTLMGGDWTYHRMTNNWNAVCSAGMIISSLITMENEMYDVHVSDKYTDFENCRANSTYLIEHNFWYLTNYGLGQYAPDGSYCESANYWSYGTNNLFQLIICLDSAAGTDFGLMDTWGLDTTCYFATHVEDSDGVLWAYNDGSSTIEYDRFDNPSVPTGMPSHFFTWVGQYIGDYDLCRIRKMHLDRGKPVSLFDCLFYNYFDDQSVELPLQYHMEGIDGYAVRSSWDKGAMYAGIMGGSNADSHGQIDIGNFIYHNKGTLWFTDLGKDNYNANGYLGSYNFYRKNAEGNNTLLIDGKTDVEFGQNKAAVAPIVETYSNEHGAYAILNTVDAYSGYFDRAKRGMLVTNDRQTVVIQDELGSQHFHETYWIAHYDLYQLDSAPEISDDGRTVYMTATNSLGETNTLRISLLSKNPGARFDTMSTQSDFILDATYTKDSPALQGGGSEYSRGQFGRLAVVQDIATIEMAVVIEIVNKEKEAPVGYEFVSMDEWKNEENLPHADKRFEGAENIATTRVSSPNYNDWFTNFDNLMADYYDMVNELEDYYLAITDMRYHYRGCRDIISNEQQQQYDGLLAKYQAFIDSVNGRVKYTNSMINDMFGIG